MEYQDGITTTGYGVAPGHMAANAAGNSSDDDEDECENAEFQGFLFYIWKPKM